MSRSLPEIIVEQHVVRSQHAADSSPSAIACGDVGGEVVDNELTFGLRSSPDDRILAIAPLASVGEGSELTMCPVNHHLLSNRFVTVDIETDASDGMVLNPAELTLAVGNMVVWTNQNRRVHTVTSDDLSFENSPLFGFGQSFRQTFDQPGE